MRGLPRVRERTNDPKERVRVPEARIVLALLIGALGGGVAALISQRPHPVCAPAACPVCKICTECAQGAAATVTAGAKGLLELPSGPIGGIWLPEGREKDGDSALQQVLKRTAINNEILVAVSNSALITEDGKYGMLATWIESVQRAGVKNFMVIALDEQTAKACQAVNVAYWKVEFKSLADNNKDNHGISSQKFHLLREFLTLGYSVFLSDVDVAWLQNPFNFIKRDSDVEGLSDGYDDRTAYGYIDGIDDPGMGWARYAQTVRIFVLNSGLFYMMPSQRTVNLMDKITDHLQSHKDWDQTVFNEKIWYPSHHEYRSAQVSVRVLDHLLYMNSKTLFKFQRHDPNGKNRLPIVVHVNYHPDKWERMKAIIRRWVDGDTAALDSFPDGSEKRRRMLK